MNTKHAPGPWKANFEHPDGAIGIRLCTGLLVAVARYSDNPQISKTDAECNARLIAAAPEMLNTMKMVTAELIKLSKDSDIPKDCLSAEIVYLKQAIAKAEG